MLKYLNIYFNIFMSKRGRPPKNNDKGA